MSKKNPDAQLLKECKALFKAKKYQQIVDTLKLKNGLHGYELDVLLAHSYFEVGKEKSDPNLFFVAKVILEQHREQGMQDAYWNFCYGSVLVMLDSPVDGAEHLQLALENLDKRTKISKEALKLCEVAKFKLSSFFFNEPLTVRTQKVWESFAQHEQEMFDLLKSSQPHEARMVADRVIKQFMGRLAIEIGYQNKEYSLIVSPDGKPALLFPLLYFVQQAPKSISKKWKIYLGRPAKPGVTGFHLYGKDLRADNVQVWCEVVDQESVKIQVYNEQLAQYYTEDKAWANFLLRILVDYELGEVVRMHYVKEVELLQKPLDAPSFTLNKIKKQLKTLGINIIHDVELLVRARAHAYVAKPEKTFVPREDVINGITQCPQLVNEYIQEETESIIALEKCGVAAAFVAFAVIDFDAKDEEAKHETVKVVYEGLLNYLHQKCCDSYVQLGNATGDLFIYVDLLMWDSKKVVKCIEEFFADQENVVLAFVHAFSKQASPHFVQNFLLDELNLLDKFMS